MFTLLQYSEINSITYTGFNCDNVKHLFQCTHIKLQGNIVIQYKSNAFPLFNFS